jgi:hypothetical protein
MAFSNAAELALTVMLQPAPTGATSPAVVESASAPVYSAATEPEAALTAATTWPCAAPATSTLTFAFEMPCRSSELSNAACVGGLIAVRDGTAAAPGGHFSASGASRFGQAIAAQTVPLMR